MKTAVPAFLFVVFVSLQPAAIAANGPGWRDPSASPDDPLWTGTSFNDSVRSTGAHLLHAIGITGAGVSAVVFDTPFDINHEAIKNNIIPDASVALSGIVTDSSWPYDDRPYHPDMELYDSSPDYDIYIGRGLQYVAVPGNAANPDYADVAHGTHVAGTVVAMAPDAGLILMTPAHWRSYTNDLVKDDIIEFYETDTAFHLVAEMADKYSIVAMNNSWGGPPYYDSSSAADADNPDTAEGLAAMIRSGVIPVMASGNDSVNNQLDHPAAFTDALAVGALAPTGLVTSFSNQSSKVMLMAPGEKIYSSVPFNQYETMRGTSMAAPHVTGALTLLASGARNASAEEIIASLVVTGDVVSYDGDQILTPAQAGEPGPWSRTVLGVVFPTFDYTQPHTFDKWREMDRHLVAASTQFRQYEASEKENNKTEATLRQEYLDKLQTESAYRQDYWDEYFAKLPDDFTMDQTEYRFIRVDKAYRNLSAGRMLKRSDGIASMSQAGAGMLDAFAGELAADLNQETAAIFQRLDAQADTRLARVARSMSPQLSVQTVEYGQMGVVGLQRAIARSGETARTMSRIMPFGLSADGCAEPLPPACPPTGYRFWAEGFGSFANRSGKISVAGYDGHFAGGMLGLERETGDLAYGLFGSYADLRVDSDDGKSDGDWYTAGLYGRWQRDKLIVQGSAAYSYGEFKPNRSIFIPGAIFPGSQPGEWVVLDPMSFATRAKTHAHNANAHLSVGYDVWEGDGWAIGPRLEGSYAGGRMRGYTESRGGSLNLKVNGLTNHYVEGGAGLAGAKVFRDAAGEGRVVASAKVSGLYGGSYGQDMRGSFVQYGTAFTAPAKRLRGMWCVPEAALRWRVNKHLDISVSYAGRFGDKYSENAGFLRFDVSW